MDRQQADASEAAGGCGFTAIGLGPSYPRLAGCDKRESAGVSMRRRQTRRDVDKTKNILNKHFIASKKMTWCITHTY